MAPPAERSRGQHLSGSRQDRLALLHSAHKGLSAHASPDAPCGPDPSVPRIAHLDPRASGFTKPQMCRRARTPGRRVLLWADELSRQQSSHCSPCGDIPGASCELHGRGWESLAADVVPDVDQHPLVHVRVVGLDDCRIDQASTLRVEPAQSAVVEHHLYLAVGIGRGVDNDAVDGRLGPRLSSQAPQYKESVVRPTIGQGLGTGHMGASCRQSA